jgi:hypothetical protein
MGGLPPDFKEFRSFLRIIIRDIGQRPRSDWTIDRIDPHNLTYGPGLVRWADKLMQANNKRATVYMTTPDGRNVLPRAEIARQLGVKPDTVRKRLQRGCTEKEAFAGKRSGSTPHAAIAENPWPEGFSATGNTARGYAPFCAAFRAEYKGQKPSRALFVFLYLRSLLARAEASLARRYPDLREFFFDPAESGYLTDKSAINYERFLKIKWIAADMIERNPYERNFTRSSSNFNDRISDTAFAKINSY